MKRLALPFLVLLLIGGCVVPKGEYEAKPGEVPAFGEITVPTATPTPFSDAYEKRKGSLLLDQGHRNHFTLPELHVLIERLVSRGYDLRYLEEGGDLEEELRLVDTLVIALPRTAFSPEEVGWIREFVDKGGRLLLIGDPARPSEINSVATEFGILFQEDFLYNLVENDGNFRNIFLSDFRESEVTRGLEKVAFYSAGSLIPRDLGIAFVDENTFSSLGERPGGFTPLALAGGVLALSDLTFFREPYNSFWDNNRLISNIADFLTTARRSFTLSDFPYFFGSTPGVAYGDISLLNIAFKAKDLLEQAGKKVTLGPYETAADSLFLGLFAQASPVEGVLEEGGISIAEAEVEVENLGTLKREGTSLLYLHRGESYLLILLADTEDLLSEAVGLLESGEFRRWLAHDRLGVYRPEEAQEELPPPPAFPIPPTPAQ